MTHIPAHKQRLHTHNLLLGPQKKYNIIDVPGRNKCHWHGHKVGVAPQGGSGVVMSGDSGIHMAHEVCTWEVTAGVVVSGDSGVHMAHGACTWEVTGGVVMSGDGSVHTAHGVHTQKVMGRMVVSGDGSVHTAYGRVVSGNGSIHPAHSGVVVSGNGDIGRVLVRGNSGVHTAHGVYLGGLHWGGGWDIMLTWSWTSTAVGGLSWWWVSWWAGWVVGRFKVACEDGHNHWFNGLQHSGRGEGMGEVGRDTTFFVIYLGVTSDASSDCSDQEEALSHTPVIMCPTSDVPGKHDMQNTSQTSQVSMTCHLPPRKLCLTLLSSCAPPQMSQTTQTSMARPKQTARKVTGGSAPRVILQVLQKKKAKTKLASKKPSPKTPANTNSFCVMCSINFMCVTCHWQKTKNDPKAYIGFYSKGEPALSAPPIIPGGFQRVMTSQVAPLPTALVHIHLQGLDKNIGHPQVAILHSFLKAYFPQKDYNFSQLPFNLATPQSMEAYEKAASDLADTLSPYSRVVLFITTHSDEDRGDPFAGFRDGNPVASKVLHFLQLLLSPIKEIFKGADMVFYVCGSMVTQEQSFNEVKEAAEL
ncbi:hypothetical protein EDC04DRAFT_2609155 [Pisolithus marmoratus]|nr:hypothetical protein EDC04DRAFT_2609155 [Pisolithus marmoratus]